MDMIYIGFILIESNVIYESRIIVYSSVEIMWIINCNPDSIEEITMI